jgi:hypothetical protein
MDRPTKSIGRHAVRLRWDEIITRLSYRFIFFGHTGYIRGSMAGLCAPLSTLRRCPRGHLRMTRGRCGSLLLHRDGLAPSTPCRSSGALRSTPTNRHSQRLSACLKGATKRLMHRRNLNGWMLPAVSRVAFVKCADRAQNCACNRPEKIETGPRSALYPGLSMN